MWNLPFSVSLAPGSRLVFVNLYHVIQDWAHQITMVNWYDQHLPPNVLTPGMLSVPSMSDSVLIEDQQWLPTNKCLLESSHKYIFGYHLSSWIRWCKSFMVEQEGDAITNFWIRASSLLRAQVRHCNKMASPHSVSCFCFCTMDFRSDTLLFLKNWCMREQHTSVPYKPYCSHPILPIYVK